MDQNVAPALTAVPGNDGAITWWLYTPPQKDNPDKSKAPADARDGELSSFGGKWNKLISPLGFVDFRSTLNGASGVVWASTRIHSETGGKRRIRAASYCALRVYKDGQLIVNKAQPTTGVADEGSANIELPKGTCEITVAATVRWGFCGFQLNLTDGNAGPPRAAAGDQIWLPLAKASQPNLEDTTLSALVFIARDPFITPGQPVQILIGMGGSRPEGLGQLSGKFFGGDGKQIGTDLAPKTADELSRQPWQLNYTVPKDVDVTHALSLEIKSGEKVFGTKKLELYSLSSLGSATAALEKDLQQKTVQAGHALPNSALAVEKLRLFQTKIENGEERVNAELGHALVKLLNDARSFLSAEAQGVDPLAGKTGYIERAYISAIDEAPQPYFAMVPTASVKNPDQKLPLVIFMHGYVPSYDKHRWWEEMHDFNVLFEEQNAFLAIPFGRSNADFQSCAEVDVLDVILEMKKHYKIDDDRVYLYGYSMGGMAVYHLAAHYPDVFAAGICLAGRADSPLQNKRPLTEFAPYKQWLIQADNPISLCENFLNIPLRIYHGQQDPIINVEEAKRMAARFKELGCNAELTLMRGDHFFGLDVMTNPEPLQWLLSQKRKTNAEKHRLKTFNLKYAAQAGAEVSAVNGDLKPIELEWSGDSATKASDNILKSTLKGAGKENFAPTGLMKTRQRCGPMRDAITHPFLLVYGTSGSADANAKNKLNAEKFAQDWLAFTKSRALIKSDREVTDADKKSKNLFLFGEEQENALHAAAASKLPINVKDGAVKIGDKSVPLDGKGVMYLYPSPFADENSSQVVVICAGLHYGKDIGANHKLDLVPDFLVYTEQSDGDGTGTNHAIVAGFFDGYWKLDPKLMWWDK